MICFIRLGGGIGSDQFKAFVRAICVCLRRVCSVS